MRMWIACAMALWLVSPGVANDGRVVGEGGRVRLLRGERTTLRMVRESIRMDVYPSHYDVDAAFVFHNHGPATTVTMGFPESGGGDLDAARYRKRSGFARFATWVDGKPVSARREASVGDSEYQAFWVKRVRFDKEQRRIVRVRYRSSPGDDITSTRGAGYSFTGGNWRGKVDETTLRAVIHLPGTTLVQFMAQAEEGKPLSGITHTGNEFLFRQTHWQAEGSAGVAYKATMSGYMFLDGFRDPATMGGPLPKWEAPARPGSMSMSGWEELTQPGRAEELDWAPPALLRRGVVFLRATVLCELLEPGRMSQAELLASALTWDPGRKEAVVSARGRSFAFQRGRKMMVVDGRTEIPLPASPLLSSPLSGGRLYVPVKPVLQLLGGAYRVSESGHRLHIDLPPRKAAARQG